jgi:hypothetical protein
MVLNIRFRWKERSNEHDLPFKLTLIIVICKECILLNMQNLGVHLVEGVAAKSTRTKFVWALSQSMPSMAMPPRSGITQIVSTFPSVAPQILVVLAH